MEDPSEGWPDLITAKRCMESNPSVAPHTNAIPPPKKKPPGVAHLLYRSAHIPAAARHGLNQRLQQPHARLEHVGHLQVAWGRWHVKCLCHVLMLCA